MKNFFFLFLLLFLNSSIYSFTIDSFIFESNLTGEKIEISTKNIVINDERVESLFYSLIVFLKNHSSFLDFVSKTQEAYENKKLNFIVAKIPSSFRSSYLEESVDFYIVKNDKNKDVTPFIYIEERFLETLISHPSLSRSLFVKALIKASIYFTWEEDYNHSLNTQLESFLYEMDSHFMQSEFIKFYIQQNNVVLSDYEKFLLSSFQLDNLNTYSLFFKQIDKKQVNALYNEINNNKSLEESLISYKAYGIHLIRNFKVTPNDSKENKYKSIIPLYTYIIMQADILSGIHIAKNPNISTTADFNTLPPDKEIQHILTKLKQLIYPFKDSLTYKNEIVTKYTPKNLY